MQKRVLRIGIPAGVAALALLLSACGGSDSSSGDATKAPSDDATSAATAAPDDGPLFGGKTAAEFYVINCSACHGAERQGISGLGLPLVPDTLVEDDAFYIDTILNGRAATVMPPWGQQGVSNAEAEALVAFFRTAP
jgi:mono/diheme cytochrome c family protein